MEFWLRIALATLSALHQRCQHCIKGALLHCSIGGCSRRARGTNDSSSASSYRRWWCTSRDLCPFVGSILINLLGITILLWLSPNKPGLSIYLINQMLFLTILIAITLNDVPTWCLPVTSSALLLTHHSAICNSGKCALCHSYNPVEYISRLFWTQFIQYHLCSCINNISSSTSVHLTTACCSWIFHAQMRIFCCSSHMPATRPQVSASQVRFPYSQRACQEAAGRNIASPPVPVFVATSIVSVYFIASLWCSSLLLRAWFCCPWPHLSVENGCPRGTVIA